MKDGEGELKINFKFTKDSSSVSRSQTRRRNRITKERISWLKLWKHAMWKKVKSNEADLSWRSVGKGDKEHTGYSSLKGFYEEDKADLHRATRGLNMEYLGSRFNLGKVFLIIRVDPNYWIRVLGIWGGLFREVRGGRQSSGQGRTWNTANFIHIIDLVFWARSSCAKLSPETIGYDELIGTPPPNSKNHVTVKREWFVLWNSVLIITRHV